MRKNADEKGLLYIVQRHHRFHEMVNEELLAPQNNYIGGLFYMYEPFIGHKIDLFEPVSNLYNDVGDFC